MTNSDDTFGTHNKITLLHTQDQEDGTTRDSAGPFPPLNIVAQVAAANAYIYTAEALAVFDECATNLQWALVADDNGDNSLLKVTLDFGTKGTPDIDPADDWAGLFESRRATLIDASGWMKTRGHVTEDSTTYPGITVTSISDHLF